MDGQHLARMLALLVIPTLTSPVFAQASAGHFDDIERIACTEGVERYLPGDYYFCAANKALQEGDARKARAMYEESARWGDKRAMFNLGLLLVNGDGLRRNEPLGLAWLALSAEREKDAMQRQVLAVAWRKAKPEVRDAANVLWNAMKLEYMDRVALPRAQQRYERETKQLRRDLMHDPLMRIRIAGIERPMGGIKAIELLDMAAAETILRPLPGAQGQVTVGNPETIQDGLESANP